MNTRAALAVIAAFSIAGGTAAQEVIIDFDSLSTGQEIALPETPFYAQGLEIESAWSGSVRVIETGVYDSSGASAYSYLADFGARIPHNCLERGAGTIGGGDARVEVFGLAPAEPPAKGFADVDAAIAFAPQRLIFRFVNDHTASLFELRMLDYGDYNHYRATTHTVRLTAYDVLDNVVAANDYTHTSTTDMVPIELRQTGDACRASVLGQPGWRTLSVAASAIARVELETDAAGPNTQDPHIGFDTIRFILDEPNPPPLELSVDIHRTSCPNPINPTSRGALPAAILGTMELDVAEIDPASLALEGCPALRWSIEDVATPYAAQFSEPLSAYDCTTEGPDGYRDLTVKFDMQCVINAISPVANGEVLALNLTANLRDGTPASGRDVIVIRAKK